MRKMLRLPTIALPLALLAAQGHAAALDQAQARLKAIAANDLPAVMAEYGAQPRFEWVGGPLDGSYADAQAINAVWQRFFAAQGPLKVTVGTIDEAANPKGATVSADLLLKGKSALTLRYVLTYRDGKLVNEVWQVAPRAGLTAPR